MRLRTRSTRTSAPPPGMLPRPASRRSMIVFSRDWPLSLAIIWISTGLNPCTQMPRDRRYEHSSR